MDPPAHCGAIATGRTVAHTRHRLSRAVRPHDAGSSNAPRTTRTSSADFRTYHRLAYLRGALAGLSYLTPLTIEVNGELIDRRLLLAFVANAGLRQMDVQRHGRRRTVDLVTIDEVARIPPQIMALPRTLLGDAVVRHVGDPAHG
jgi:hypothetical protein